MKTQFLISLFILLFSSFLYGNPESVQTEQVINSVAKIKSPKGQATGFFINQDTLVTSAHVIVNESGLIPIESIRIDKIGRIKNLSVRVTNIKAISFLYDLTLLKVTGYTGPTLTFGDHTSENNIYALGFINENLQIITGTNVQNTEIDYYFSGPFSNNILGSSGGPVFNSHNQVVGIMSSHIFQFYIRTESHLLKRSSPFDISQKNRNKGSSSTVSSGKGSYSSISKCR